MITDIDAASERIAILVTTFRNDSPQIDALICALERAVLRGVSVSVAVDTLTYTEIHGKSFSITKQGKGGLGAIKLEWRLMQAGIEFCWLGKQTGISFLGRTHAKWMIIDNAVYIFGGCNIDRMSFENTDYMLRIAHPRLAHYIARLHSTITHYDAAGSGLRNQSLKTAYGTIWLDGGMLLNSQIYRRACQLAKTAQAITLVSQYCPTGKLMRLIKSTRRHAIYFNHIANASLLNSLILRLGLQNGRLNRYNHSNYLHAKFIIFTDKRGQKTALLGSHNFIRASGILGTIEIALETHNRAIIEMLETFTREFVA